MEEISRKLKKHYEQTFDKFGETPEGVDWGNKRDRVFLRYKKMLALLSEEHSDNPSLLDVGCGYGGLLEYLIEGNSSLHYTGIDVAENMIKSASNRFPQHEFMLGDVLNFPFDRKFDYVVCNGVLTQKLDVPGITMDHYAGRLIRRMFELCRFGIAFNVMTTKVNYFSNNLYYRNPVEMAAWCMTEISPYIRLDHSYPLYEYTVYLYGEPL